MAQKKGKSKKSPVKKGKVTVSPVGLISLCGGVIIFCLILLLITTIAEKTPVKEKIPAENSVKTEKTVTAEKTTSDSTIDLKELKKTRKTAGTSGNTVHKEAEPQKQVSPVNTPQTQKTTQSGTAIEVVPQKNVEKVIAKPEVKSAVTTEVKTEPKIEPKIEPKPEVKTESKPAPVYAFDFPNAVNHAQLCILLDDGGQNLEDLKKYIGLKIPLTVAVLPKLRDTVSSANAVRAAGLELMLHQPMQAVNLNVNPGPGAIKPDMTSDQIRSLVLENLREVGPVSGMNNHEGSLITADISKMETIIDTAHMQGIYFLDSRTNVETKIPYVSRELGYGWYERNGYFLDNEKTREEFLKELRKNLDIANKTGCVIMIAHVWSANYLPALIREVYPELVAKGYSFTTVSKSRGLKN